MTRVYKYTYILLICFLNTGRTISDGRTGSLTALVYSYSKCFHFFFPSLSFFWVVVLVLSSGVGGGGGGGECMGGAAPYHSLIFFNLTS